jgi:integrase
MIAEGVEMARKAEGRDESLIEEPKGSGNWFVRIYHGGRRYKRRAASKSHARQLRDEIRVAIRRGEWPPKAKSRTVLFDELLDDYRYAKRREGKAVMQGEFAWRRLHAAFGGRRADELSAREVESLRDEMLQTLSVASVNRHLTLLRAILNRAVRDGRLDMEKNPAIKLLKETNGRVRYLSDGEEAHLMESLPAWLRPLVLTAIHTGLRRGELLKLRWNDVDLIAGAITISKGKSGFTERIPINQTVRQVLARVHGERRQWARATGDARELFGRFVFCAPGGGYLHALNRYWYPAMKRAGIEDFRFHDLRHTCLSRLAMKGADFYAIQRLARHRRPEMTMRYAHLSPGHLRTVAELLDAPAPVFPTGQSAGQSSDNSK